MSRLSEILDTIAHALPMEGMRNQSSIFIGPESSRWDPEAAAEAYRLMLENIDIDPRELWRLTGTGFTPRSNYPIQEISDHRARLTGLDQGRVSDVLDHPDLPEELDPLGVMVDQTLPLGGIEGYFTNDPSYSNHGTNIYIGAGPGRPGGAASQEEAILRSLIHELNHAAEHGAPRGHRNNQMEHQRNLDPFLGHQHYSRLETEAMARLASNRWNLTPEQRREQYPFDDPLEPQRAAFSPEPFTNTTRLDMPAEVLRVGSDHSSNWGPIIPAGDDLRQARIDREALRNSLLFDENGNAPEFLRGAPPEAQEALELTSRMLSGEVPQTPETTQTIVNLAAAGGGLALVSGILQQYLDSQQPQGREDILNLLD